MTAKPDQVVRNYLERLEAHDTEAAVARLAPDFEIEFPESGFRMGRGDAARALAWDAGANGRMEWTVTEVDGSRATVEGTETNDFLRLLGVGELSFTSVFELDEEGRIRRQRHEVDWGSRSLPEAMAPLVAWAREHEPEELERLYPEGRMVYSEPMARGWVALARKWKDATAEEAGP